MWWCDIENVRMDTVFTILECLRLITEIEYLDTVWMVRLYLPSSICDARTNEWVYLFNGMADHFYLFGNGIQIVYSWHQDQVYGSLDYL